MSGIEHHVIDCEVLERLWRESGIVSARNNGNRTRKWKEIAWKYNSEKALADPVDVLALQSEWHEMITRRGSKFLKDELKKDLAPRQVRAILNNRLENEPQPQTREAQQSVEVVPGFSTAIESKDMIGVEGEMVSGGRHKRTESSDANEPRKRRKTYEDVNVQDSIDSGKNILIEINKIRKEAVEKEKLLNETLLKVAEVELEEKRDFWKTKNKIAKEELEKASAEKEAALAQRITALLNRNEAIAKYNIMNGKKITLPSPPDL